MATGSRDRRRAEAYPPKVVLWAAGGQAVMGKVLRPFRWVHISVQLPPHHGTGACSLNSNTDSVNPQSSIIASNSSLSAQSQSSPAPSPKTRFWFTGWTRGPVKGSGQTSAVFCYLFASSSSDLAWFSAVGILSLLSVPPGNLPVSGNAWPIKGHDANNMTLAPIPAEIPAGHNQSDATLPNPGRLETHHDHSHALWLLVSGFLCGFVWTF